MKLSSNNVSHYLLDAGIWSQQNRKLMTINSKSSKGKNNLIFLTVKLPSGRQFFIKQDYHHHNSNTGNRVKNEWLLQKFLRNCHDLYFASSLNLKIIHFDESNSILIYECQKNLIDVQSYYISQKAFPTGIAELMGTSLAYLHRETFTSKDCYDFMNEIVEGKSCYQFPYPSHLLDRVTIETLIEEFLPQGYRFLAFYQSSESLRAALTEVVATHHHCCLTHNNLQLNNILIPIYSEKLLFQPEQSKSNKTIIKLINWDNCSWGDPAFDLGTAIAGYLLLWLNSLIIHPAITLEQSLQLATIPLEVIQPSIVALTRSYIISFPQVLKECPDFFKRVVQFTGLALIYNIIAMIQSFQDFNNQGICTLQLAKSLLCRPEESFKSVFGMTELALSELIPLARVR